MSKRILLSTCCLVIVSMVLHGQPLPNPPPEGPSQIAKFFPAAALTASINPTAAGLQNVQTLVGGYITPIAEDFGGLISNGWYNTGANHKRFGFDLSIAINAVSANSASKYYSINALQGVAYNGTQPTSSGAGKAPTAYGPESEFPSFNFNSGPNNLIPFYGPSGGNISKDVPIGSIAVPTIQAGIGLFANTDLRFRFTPEITINKTALKSWGVGLLHDIKQHIPGIKMAPISLSLLLAYSQMTATTDLGGVYYTQSSGNSFSGQEGLGETKSYTAQILISKTIPVLTFYGGIGYNSATTTYAINGSYYVDKAYTDLSVPGITLPSPVKLVDPFKQDFSVGGIRFTGGIRFKFGPVFLNTDYTYFNSKGLYTMGFGFTIH